MNNQKEYRIVPDDACEFFGCGKDMVENAIYISPKLGGWETEAQHHYVIMKIVCYFATHKEIYDNAIKSDYPSDNIDIDVMVDYLNTLTSEDVDRIIHEHPEAFGKEKA